MVRLIPVFLIGLIWAFSGCQQKDSAVGSDIAPGLNDVFPEEKLLYPSQTATFYELATTGDSDWLYIGRAQGYESHILLKFNPYSALPDSYAIDSFAVKLWADSIIVADPTSPMQVDVSFIDEYQSWAEIGVVWGDLDTANIPPPNTSFELPGDQLSEDEFQFSLYEYDYSSQDSLIRAWEWVGSGGKSLYYNSGLYLKSDKTTEHLVRFCSAEHDSVALRPKLEMYITVFDTTDGGVDTTYADTSYIYAGADAFIVTDSAVLDPDFLYLGNAVSYRTILLFDLEGLFPAWGVGVHRAEVVLHADTTNQFQLGQITGTYNFEMSDTTWITAPETAPYELGTYQSPSYYDEETAILTLNITDIVYNWIRYPGTNNGFMIRTSAPLEDISRTAFFGTNAADSLQPHLSIIYLDNTP
ncbi:hypothetical protein CEE37_06525 [candidate division LCP-89 bacterium B3_LCP]|uniref:DNRLRE domain-containing protein n=1 Tax=candidate division LCP-89 bacterium B3_LCP TaxID=2012998 RepID=A0A532V076_UNCL8|nr:MAG: hypothetical protein CEE37_06525 [candidate division LCP-89 bacterium B3_LCP]